MRGNVKDFNQEQAGNNCWAWDYRVIYSGIIADKALRIRANISRNKAHNRRITGKKYSVLSWLETKIVWDPIWIKFTKMIVMWFNLKWLLLLGRGKSWKKFWQNLKIGQELPNVWFPSQTVKVWKMNRNTDTENAYIIWRRDSAEKHEVQI